MLFLRQGATHKVLIGPVVAVGDGFTPVTTLALNTADEAEALVHDSATVVDISAYTFAAVATANGYYVLTLQSGISGTVGHMTVLINDDSLCLPVKTEFTVLEEAVYDAFYAASATGVPAAGALEATAQSILTDTAVIGSTGQGLTSLATQASVNTIDDFLDTEIAAITAAVITNAAGVDIAADIIAIKAETAAILADTDVIGAAGAGLTEAGGTGDHLTAINLPNQTMDITGNITGNLSGSVGSVTGAVGSVTGDVGGLAAGAIADVWTTALTEAYAADGAAFTGAQALFMVWAFLAEKAIVTTTLTANQLDGVTPAMTFTLDDGTNPTSLTRAT